MVNTWLYFCMFSLNNNVMKQGFCIWYILFWVSRICVHGEGFSGYGAFYPYIVFKKTLYYISDSKIR